ncbi:MAG TPA: hypothetical protein DC047_08555 [Blastocatellia bacterium]|nr:hypothetical protein [Blastocatellia bacterium]
MGDELTAAGQARPNMGLHPGLWMGALLPPIIWAAQMELNYWAVRGACVRGSNLRLFFVTLVAVLVIAFSGLCAWIGARRSGAGERVAWGALVSNSRFMLALGLMSGVIFFIAVLAQGIAAVILHPCQL